MVSPVPSTPSSLSPHPSLAPSDVVDKTVEVVRDVSKKVLRRPPPTRDTPRANPQEEALKQAKELFDDAQNLPADRAISNLKRSLHITREHTTGKNRLSLIPCLEELARLHLEKGELHLAQFYLKEHLSLLIDFKTESTPTATDIENKITLIEQSLKKGRRGLSASSASGKRDPFLFREKTLEKSEVENFKKEIEKAKRALDGKKDPSLEHYKLATLYASIRDPQLAIFHMEKAVEQFRLDPQYAQDIPMALANLAELYFEACEDTQAKKAAEEAIQLAKKYSNEDATKRADKILANYASDEAIMGLINERMDKSDLEKDLVKKRNLYINVLKLTKQLLLGSELHPMIVFLYFRIVESCSENGNGSDSIISEMERGLKLANDLHPFTPYEGRVAEQLATQYFFKGKFGKSVEYFTLAANIFDKYGMDLEKLFCKDKLEIAQVEHDLQETPPSDFTPMFSKLNRKKAEICIALAETCVENGDFNKALKTYLRAKKECHPLQMDLYAQLLLGLANTSYLVGSYSDAERYYRQAFPLLSLNSKDGMIMIYTLWGLACYKNHDYPNATRFLKISREFKREQPVTDAHPSLEDILGYFDDKDISYALEEMDRKKVN